MPNFEQPPINVPENSDEEEIREEAESVSNQGPKNNEGNTKKKGVLGRAMEGIGIALAIGGVIGHGSETQAASKSAEAEFTNRGEKNTEQVVSSENTQEKLDSIGTLIANVETDNKDFEIRSVSLNELGFKSYEDFVNQFSAFRYDLKNKFKYEYKNISEFEKRSLTFHDFVNKKLEEILGPGHEAFINSWIEWQGVTKEFERLSEQELIRMQIGMVQTPKESKEQGFGLNYLNIFYDKLGNAHMGAGGLNIDDFNSKNIKVIGDRHEENINVEMVLKFKK
jgi:hypothetical protein